MPHAVQLRDRESTESIPTIYEWLYNPRNASDILQGRGIWGVLESVEIPDLLRPEIRIQSRSPNSTGQILLRQGRCKHVFAAAHRLRDVSTVAIAAPFDQGDESDKSAVLVEQ